MEAPAKEEKGKKEDASKAKKNTFHQAWNFSIGAKDSSLKGDKFLELQVFSFDLNPSNIIPDLDVKTLNMQNEKTHQQFKTFVSDLMTKTDKQSCEFIVEPLVSKKKVIFRIVDTVFSKKN